MTSNDAYCTAKVTLRMSKALPSRRSLWQLPRWWYGIGTVWGMGVLTLYVMYGPVEWWRWGVTVGVTVYFGYRAWGPQHSPKARV